MYPGDWVYEHFGRLLILGIIIGAVLLTLTIRYGTRWQDHSTCINYGRNTNRQVKFVDYNYWSWDCLTPSGHGKWISTGQLREFSK